MKLITHIPKSAELLLANLTTCLITVDSTNGWQRSKDKMTAIANAALDAILMMDPSGKISYWNPAAEDIFGYTSDEAIGQNLHALITPARYHPAHHAAFPAFLKSGKGLAVGKTLDLEALRKDGSEIAVRLSLSSIQIDGHWHAIGVIRDVTERKRVENESQRQAALINSLLDSIPDLIFFKDTQGVYMGCNPAFAEFTGRSRNEIVGKTDHDLFDKEIADSFQEQDRLMLPRRKARHNEEWVTYPDGRKVLLDTLKTPYWGPTGELIGVLGISRDITEQKHAANEIERVHQLEETTAKAERMNEAKSQFLASMSHEIRTPMNGIIGMTTQLLENDLAPAQRERAEIVQFSAEALLVLINNILDFSRIEDGKLDLELLDFGPVALLDNLAGLLAPQAAKKGLDFRCDIAPDVPHSLCGDSGRLRQILLNLVGNAIKFTPRGAVSVHVRLASATATASVLRFAVRDTGIGIAADKQALLFQKFSQVDASTTRRYGGSGLGLAISKQLVGLMGGEIGASSVADQGSEFWFTARFTAGIRPTPASAAPPPAAKPRWSGLRILLAEDNIINQKVAIGFLKPLGLQVDVVANGVQAIQALAAHPYDLVLMDMQMPEMGGLEATRLIRGALSTLINQRVPIIAMTANAAQSDRQDCLNAGMNDYLSKPLNPQMLATMLVQWLPQAPVYPA